MAVTPRTQRQMMQLRSWSWSWLWKRQRSRHSWVGQLAHTSLTLLSTRVVPPKCGNMPARISCVETRLVVLCERSRWFASAAPLFIDKQPSLIQVELYMYRIHHGTNHIVSK